MKKITLILLVAFYLLTVNAQNDSKSESFKFEPKFGFQTDLTYNFIQLKATEMTNFHFAVMPGLHLCDYMFAGIGAEYAYYNSFNLFPVFAHGTINFTNGKIIPFIQGKIGYAFGGKTGPIDYNLLNNNGTYATPLWLSKVNGNFYFAPSFGVKFKTSGNAKIILAVVGDLMMFKIAKVSDPETFDKLKNVTMGIKVGLEL
jgi:hypothetical protein